MNGIEGSTERRAVRPGRETLVGLLRKPAVLALMGVTAAAQVVMVEARGVGEKDSPLGALDRAVPTVELAPAVVQPDTALQRAWLEKATRREAERLAEEYREDWFSVSPKLAMQIGEAAAEYEIEPEVAFGLVRAESSFRNQATSQVGAVGLTQLMPRTAQWIEPGVSRSELRDPETNLRVGFKYLRYLIDRYKGNEKLALLAYNRGPGTVDKALKRGRNPDNGYADFVYGKEDHGHELFTR